VFIFIFSCFSFLFFFISVGSRILLAQIWISWFVLVDIGILIYTDLYSQFLALTCLSLFVFSLLKFLKFMFNIIEFDSSAFYLLLNTNKERQVSARNWEYKSVNSSQVFCATFGSTICIYVLSCVLWCHCDFRIKTMFGSFLPPVW
jgi:hypothetical protein